MRIGLFGGSFNPIHKGHIKCAKFAIKNLNLDKLVFIPAFKTVDKLDTFYEKENQRIELIKLVLPQKSEISLYEINLQHEQQSIYTIKYFSNLYKNKKLFFLLGDDHINGIESWENISEINKLCTIVFFKRKQQTTNINFKYLNNFLYLNNSIFNYSSKDFRENNKNQILEKKVLDYIKNNSLYSKQNV